MMRRDIAQFPRRLAEEMVMIRCIGIKIGSARLNHSLAQQPSFGELVQRVVDGRQGYFYAGCHRLAVQMLRGDMPIAALK